MKLYIAEKPSVGRAIAEILGVKAKNNGYIECVNDYVVTWCFGHMYHLCEPDHYTPDSVPVSEKTQKKLWRFDELPIFPKCWDMEATETCKEQIKTIKNLLKGANEVINAGDPDREGQLLIDELLEELKFTGPVKRYWANAVDDKSVKRAVENLQNNADYQGLANSARGRGRADWLVGMNLSRAFTLSNRTLITVGRVQTPTLKLVYDRDMKIKNFKPVDYYNLIASFNAEKGVYKGKFVPSETQKGLDEEGRLVDKNVADEIAKNITSSFGVIESVKKENKKTKQPLGLSLADLTSLTSSKLGLTAQQTLDIVQSLYEKKYTSYPRTDCQYLPEAQYTDSVSVLEAIKSAAPELAGLIDSADKSIHTKTWNTEKTTAHHAIIPTAAENLAQLQGNELKVYDLIARSYIAQFYPEHEFLATEIVTVVNDYKFITKGKTVINNGWKAVYSNSDEEEKESNDSIVDVAQNEQVKSESCNVESAKTKAPPKFTEGSLIKAMENIYKFVDDEEYKKQLKDGDGIGTSATRAAIIEELKKRTYIVNEGKYIVSTDKAAALLAVVPKETQSPIMTAQYERDLKEVEAGNMTLETFVEKCQAYISSEVENAKGKIKPFENKKLSFACPICGKALLDMKFSFKCEDTTCNFSCQKEILGAKITDSDLQKIINNKSPEFKFISNKTQKEFKAKLKLDREEKKVVFDIQKQESAYKCPKCGKPLIRRENSKNKGVFFWGCSGYKDGCKAIFSDVENKPKF